ncbi:MAG TPA: sulfatase [Candidatus Binataceae bacterium]|nr:sulfatase [Candidatus Binataceae bacterium]
MSAPANPPKNAIVVLLDSLNRHLLGAYGSREFATPNLDKFARRAVRFDKHYTGSLPCMPARHDILCGAMDFLWRPWGSIEIWEEPVTAALRAAKVTTKLVSDHPHLFEVGGENYHCDFDAWDYQRGHESDAWKTRPDPSWIGAPSFGRGWMPYDSSRGHFRGEEDFPGPRTLSAAARWLDTEAPAHDRFMLFIDEFDPHEPFDTPEPYASMYDPGWQGPHLIWPPYMRGAIERGVLSPAQAYQVRASYGAKLTMIDKWFGKLVDSIERGGFFANTAVIVGTDHGHYLGEKDTWGKPAVPVYETLGHIPMMIAWPGIASRTVGALTTNVDLHATICNLFGVTMKHRTHGRSVVPLITGEQHSIRDWALSGVWGREVHLIDGARKYARAPQGDNAPLSVWSNRWSTMPAIGHPELKLPLPDDRAVLDRMPGSKVPVIRQPFGAGERLPFWANGKFSGNHLYDLVNDPGEDRNLAGNRGETDAADALRAALVEMEAPSDQFVRLGLK